MEAAPAPETAPAKEAASGAPELAGSIQEAWARWLEAGKGIPKGMAAFLRSASVEDGADGSVVISVIPGPAEEKLADAEVRRKIGASLKPFLGRTPEIVIQGGGGAAPKADERITQDAVREDTLKAMYREEPRLERAVQELDLELMD